MKAIQLKDYDIEVKVKRDSYGKIVSGMIIGDVLHQNQAIILSMRKGDLKENPSIGVGLSDLLLEHNLLSIRSEIRQQLELDGQTVNSIKVTESSIVIDAKY